MCSILQFSSLIVRNAFAQQYMELDTFLLSSIILLIIFYKQGGSLRSPPAAPVLYNIPPCSYTHCMCYHVSTAMKGQTLLLRRGHSKGKFKCM